MAGNIKKREPLRIKLRGAMTAVVSIADARDGSAMSKETPVLVDAIGMDCLEFRTYLRFPIQQNYMLRIVVTIGQWQLHLLAQVSWRREAEHMYVYGCTFVQDEPMAMSVDQALRDFVKRLNPNYKRIHQLYARMSGGSGVSRYRFDQKG